MGYTLTTERLRLRPLQMTDVNTLHHLANNPDIAANLSDLPYPYPREAAEGLVQAMPPLAEQGQAFAFAIVPENRLEDDTLAGVVFLILDMANQRGELIYWLGKPYWGQGYATEAARQVICFGFEELKLNRIHASAFKHNPASAHVLQKVGMQCEGVQRQHFYKNGAFVDLENYGLLREEYEQSPNEKFAARG